MSYSPGELVFVPFMILIMIGVVGGTWLATNGGDPTLATGLVEALALPALIIGVVLAVGVAVLNAL